jgi:hypothetical protein
MAAYVSGNESENPTGRGVLAHCTIFVLGIVVSKNRL